MATSGQLTTNEEYNSYFWVKWAQSGDQDIPNNQTKIDWSCGVYCGYSFYSNAIKMSAVSINGTEVYKGGTYSNYYKGDHTIASGQMWIKHDSDGKKTFKISSFTGWLYASHNYSSTGGSFALTQIPRKAEITSVSDFTDLDNPSFSYSNPGGFPLDVWLEPNPVGDHLCIREDIQNSTGTYQWTLTDEEREELRNKSNGKPQYTIRVGLYTDIGGTIHSDYEDKTFTIKESDVTKPSLNMDVALNNSSLLSKFDGLCIQGKSKVDVKLSAEGKYGANITNLYAVIDGKTYNSVPFTSDVIQNSGNVVGYAKDSRGFTNSVSEPIEVIPYSKPLVVPLHDENAILCYRSDGNGKRIGNSSSVWIKAKRTFYSVSGKNQCALEWRKKLTTDGWNDSVHLWDNLIDKSVTSTDEYNAMLSGVEFDKKKSYTVQIRAIDDIGEYDIKTFEIPTEDVALHLGRGGKKVSVGTYCNDLEDYTFYSEWVGIFDKGLFGSSLNFNVTDVLTFPEQCTDGITPIIINESTNKDNLPDGHYAYSVGIVHKRADDQYNVILMDYMTGKIAINVFLSGTWTGWKYIIPQ